ncbi:MAG: hypothetical protein NXY57DRAFT_1044737 [Lentinula lateritia]|nr:MAG: hypothetical protein NXY57DRAFT_1044737 [Lentinula lateritia]
MMTGSLGTLANIITNFTNLVINVLNMTFQTAISTTGTQFQSFSMCDIELNHVRTYSILQIIVPFLGLANDLIIFVLTVQKTIHHAIEMRRMGEPSIVQVIIRDGTFYFLAMLLVSVMQALYKVAITQGVFETGHRNLEKQDFSQKPESG